VYFNFAKTIDHIRITQSKNENNYREILKSIKIAFAKLEVKNATCYFKLS